MDTEEGIINSRDPYASRNGKALSWTNVNMTLQTMNNGGSKQILKDVWGIVPEKSLSVVLGPSGSGKSSLLNIIGGRISARGKISISGEIKLDHQTVNPKDIRYKKRIAFVPEEDFSLLKTATPREAIHFSAKLRLSHDTEDESIDHLVEKTITELDLQDCADTMAGGFLLKGLSKGERRRLLVGIELVVKPMCILLDEPTTGLDSFHAKKLIEVLEKIADSGSSVLCTIHQPSSAIFHAFQHLILINHGRVMYQGSAGSAIQFFEDCGYKMPQEYNPADWILSVAQSDPEQCLEGAGFFPRNKETFACTEQAPVGNDLTRDVRHVSFWMELHELLRREIRHTSRDLVQLLGRCAITLITALVIGIVFRDLGRGDPSDPMIVGGISGAIMLYMLTSIFGSSLFALVEFPDSRPVFITEYSTDHYGVASYFVSKLTIDAVVILLQGILLEVVVYFMVGFSMSFWLLFGATYFADMGATGIGSLVGCTIHQRDLAQEFLPLIIFPQAVLSGLFVAVPLIPKWVRWVQYLCSLIYANRLAVLAEFSDCEVAEPCQAILVSIDAKEDERWWYWLGLVAIIFVTRVPAIFLLRRNATTFR